MKEEILELGKETGIYIGKLLVGMGTTIVVGKYVNAKFDKEDARLNPKRKGISKILHRDNRQSSSKKKK